MNSIINPTALLIHLENNHRKINTLQEIEILKAASFRDLLNDVIDGRSNPVHRHLPSGEYWNSNGPTAQAGR